MQFAASRHADADAGSSRFGESRFGPARGGAWLEEGQADGSGRTSGLYRAPDADGGVAQLTVLRPTSPGAQPALVAMPSVSRPKGPKALSLPGGRRGVLLFHGLSSSPLELQYLARGLHRAGFSVRIPVIQGYSHGLPAPTPAGHQEWAAAALAEFDRMREQCDSLAVGGLCIGALLSLHVAAERPDRVSHLLSLSTTLRYDGWAVPRTRLLLPLARVLPWAGRIAVKEREPFGLKDARLRAWIAAQMKESGGSDAGAAAFRVRDLLQAQDLMQLVRRGLKRICAPTLLIHAREDEAASPKSAYEVASGVSSSRVHCVFLNDCYHMISIDKEKARVLSEMKDFLQDPPSPDASSGAASQIVTTPATARSQTHVRA